MRVGLDGADRPVVTVGEIEIGPHPRPLVLAVASDVLGTSQKELARLEDEAVDAVPAKDLLEDIAISCHFLFVGPLLRPSLILQVHAGVDQYADAARVGVRDQLVEEIVFVGRMGPANRVHPLVGIPDFKRQIHGTSRLVPFQPHGEPAVGTQREHVEAIFGHEVQQPLPLAQPPQRGTVGPAVADIPGPLRAEPADAERGLVIDLDLGYPQPIVA